MDLQLHNLHLENDEAFRLYLSLVESHQKKEMEYEQTLDPTVLKEVNHLRRLINKVFSLMINDASVLNLN
jgi:hypothetical protein